MVERCSWCEDDLLYREYHDREWGCPVLNDQKQFEFLVLESAQAGLSWLAILKKREHYRQAYFNFDPAVVANFGEKEVARLLENSGIIRNQRKIRASINNARRFLEIQNEFGSFCNYLWAFVENRPQINSWNSLDEIPAQTPLSEKISRDMRGKGFQFIGPKIVYSHLQATGLVNDHLRSCFRFDELLRNYPYIFPGFKPAPAN